MMEKSQEDQRIEEDIKRIEAHFQNLDTDSRIAAMQEMELAVFNPNAQEVPQWIRGVHPQAIVRSRMQIRGIVRTSEPPESVSAK
ncbi:hypothetical protein JXD20_03975 [Candidatus Peregrinibacteria bacterium]|nr:hypothetical protein [Candidatus Peregrinibacteria bacterium]